MRPRLLIPLSILLAAGIVALAIYTIEHAKHPGAIFGSPDPLLSMRPLGSDDHILGNPSAPVVVVEYGDIDCPFCKEFHQTMEDIMAAYGPTGQVAWVFRHFPIVGLHQFAEEHAEAAECVASLGGSSAFWQFIDALHAAAPGANQFDPAGYNAIVESLGISTDQFQQCLTAGTFKNRVQEDYDNAIATGGDGTPWSILLVKGQPPAPIVGALSYDDMKALIDEAVSEAAQASTTAH